MISVAEESNTLDQVLVDIADGLERRTSRHLDLMVRLLEPDHAAHPRQYRPGGGHRTALAYFEDEQCRVSFGRWPRQWPSRKTISKRRFALRGESEMNRRGSRRRRGQGFTLMEVLLVLVILVILGSLVGVGIRQTRHTGV